MSLRMRWLAPALIVVAASAGACGPDRESALAEPDRDLARSWARLAPALELRSRLVPQLLKESRGAPRVRLSTLLELSRARQRVQVYHPALLSEADLEAYTAAHRELERALDQLRAEARGDEVLRARPAFQRLLAEVERTEQAVRRLQEEHERALHRSRSALGRSGARAATPPAAAVMLPGR